MNMHGSSTAVDIVRMGNSAKQFKFHRTELQSLFHFLLHYSHYMFRPYL
jgi:hypothetical protein